MKAILLAGGKGTRLRPLTVHTPKPIVPILNRPFLYYQIDLLRQIPEIDEVILSLNYQPRRIEEIFGEGEGLGIRVRYVVEPMPLGTGGAIRYAGDSLTESVVVFNGDVLTQVDLAAVLRLHRERKAKATIVLTPVDNPRAYGLVETDRDGQHQALPREAGRRRDHLQHDQRRHLRARARHLRPHPEGHRLVDRAQLLPVADRARRDVRRLRRERLLDRHRHARPSTWRSTTTSWTAAIRRRRSTAPPAAWISPDARVEDGRRDHRPVLHRRRRR